MTKKLLFVAVASISMGLSGVASAAQLTPGSTLSLNGSDTFTSTSITFSNPANIGGESGSFGVLANCTGCVTMTSFTSGTATPFTMYSAAEGALSTSLSVASDTFSFTPGVPLNSLNISGTGTLTLSGFDPTPGTFLVTTQGTGGVTVTFSVTSVATTPLPAALPLFATGVGLLGFFGRRKLRQRSA
jgi:hypothetical protein